jgi:hypothetical protein
MRLVEQIASAADVLFSLVWHASWPEYVHRASDVNSQADSDNLQAEEAILRGLKKRVETTRIKPTLLRMVSIAEYRQ